MRIRRPALALAVVGLVTAGGVANAVTVTSALASAPRSAPMVGLPSLDSTDLKYEVLSEDLYDPMNVQVAPDGRVIIGQRDGKIRVWHQDGTIKTAGQLPVNAQQCPTCAEDINDDGGIYSMLLDRQFTKNGYVYLWYGRAHTGNPETNLEEWRLSRITVTPQDTFDLKSEKVLYTAKSWYLDPEGSQAHYGGVLEWLPDGTLLLGTGDETDPKSDGGYGPRDETAGAGYYWNAELTSQNPASSWGKILRFNKDGSIPDGKTKGVKANPFIGKSLVNPYIPNGTNHVMHYNPWAKPFKAKPIKFLPEIYAMGFKQPWRGAVDPKTGNLIMGEVGPDAQTNSEQKGPKAYEEINVIPYGGGTNHGWPRCVGPNLPYTDFDWTKNVSRGSLSCKGFAKPEFWYTTTDISKDWPIVGVGPKTSEVPTMIPSKPTGSLAFPQRYAGSAIVMEFSRGYILSVPVTKGHLNTDESTWIAVRPPIPTNTFVGVQRPGLPPKALQSLVTMLSPIDATIGADGAMYIVEYGSGYYNNSLSRLSRITCAGCKANPAKDFGAAAAANGVPTVPADKAFQGGTGTSPVAHNPQSSSVRYVVGGSALAALTLVVLISAARRRRLVLA